MSRFRSIETETPVALHVHLRDENEATMRPLIAECVAGGANWFGPMPNTTNGLKTAKQVRRYVDFAKRLVPDGKEIGILPIAMATEETTISDVDAWVDHGIFDCKFYPRDRTTKSHNGIRDFYKLLPIVKHCGRQGIRCHFHPEIPLMTIDNSTAEYLFLPIIDMFLNETEGPIIWEHGTDAKCIPTWYKFASSGRFFVSITPQGLLVSENESFGDANKTYKTPARDRLSVWSLVKLVEEDNEWVIGSDDLAPHDFSAKHPPHGPCSCGAYHGRYTYPLYAHALDEMLSTQGGVKIFENFTSKNPRRIHGLPSAEGKITLIRKPFTFPLTDQIGPWKVGFCFANQEIDWQLKA